MNEQQLIASVLATLKRKAQEEDGVDHAKRQPAPAATQQQPEEEPKTAAHTTSHRTTTNPNHHSEPATKKSRKNRRPPPVQHVYPVEPRPIQILQRPRTHTNHSYRDFSHVPPTLDYQPPVSIETMTFAEKVHDMLTHHSNYISWNPHGRSFAILVPKRLEQEGILHKYLGHGRYSSFLRQLTNHGFRHITKGRDRNSYYHECFLKDRLHLCQSMPPAKDCRRLIPDPEHEPDFYAISALYPVETTTTTTVVTAGMGQPSVAAQLLQCYPLSWNR